MSFDINKQANPQLPQNIIFDTLQKKIISNSDIISRHNDYIKYSFYDGKSALTINGNKYYNGAIYVWKGKIHDIQSIDYDGEFIIEFFNGNEKVFLCFLLKYTYGNSETFIDKLCLKNMDDTLVDFQPLIDNSKRDAIFYKDGINKVIVYLSPIKIKTQLIFKLPFAKCYIIPNYSPDYNIVHVNFPLTISTNEDTFSVKTLQESFFSYMEGFAQPTDNFIAIDPSGNIMDISGAFTGISQPALAENGLYLDCAPTSQSTETIPSITLPLDKNGNLNLSNSLLFSSIMNSLILFILIAFVFLTLPTFYKWTFIDVIAKNNVPDKGTRLKTVCILAFIAISIFCISLICDGVIHQNMYQAYAGIFVGLMLLVSMGRLYFLRNNNDYNFQQIYNWSPVDIFVFFKESYNYVLDNFNTICGMYVIFNILVILCFLLPAYLATSSFLPPTDTVGHATTVILAFGFSYNLIFVPFVHLVGTTFSVNNTN
jgi:hypothetical protein